MKNTINRIVLVGLSEISKKGNRHREKRENCWFHRRLSGRLKSGTWKTIVRRLHNGIEKVDFEQNNPIREAFVIIGDDDEFKISIRGNGYKNFLLRLDIVFLYWIQKCQIVKMSNKRMTNFVIFLLRFLREDRINWFLNRVAITTEKCYCNKKIHPENSDQPDILPHRGPHGGSRVRFPHSSFKKIWCYYDFNLPVSLSSAPLHWHFQMVS